MSRSDVEIRFEDGASKARYVARVEGMADVAELTVSKMSDATWIADHTGVPDSMRGMGVGEALVRHLIEDSRAAGRKIVPLCPFVRAQARRHPDWADVLG